MKLVRLDIHVLAGLEDSFSLDFAPDRVNFITGPNASGKSSIIRAVRALLYPDQHPEFCHLRARWQLDGREIECERHGTVTTWLDGSDAIPPPRLPGSDSVGAYLVSSEDLTRLGATESHIAAHIRTMLAGGYDLDAVLAQPPLAMPRRPQKLASEVTDLQRQVRDKEDEYARLNEELATLEQLGQELQSTADAGNRLRACDDALALADAIADLDAIEQTMSREYPDGMDRLRGDESARLEQIEKQLGERRKERQIVERSLAQLEKRLDDSGAVDPHELEALQSEMSDFRDRLAEIEREIQTSESRLAQAHRDRIAAAQRLGGETPETPVELDLEQLEQFERLVDRVLLQREKIRGLSGELARSHVPRSEPAIAPERLRKAHQALVDWLEHCHVTLLEGALWAGLTAAAGLAAWRVLGPHEIGAVPELILLILLAAGVPLTLLVKFVERYRSLGQARVRFQQTGIESPLGWTEEEVQARLQRLASELEEATHQQVRQARAAEVRERLNAERHTLEQAREKLATQAESMGLDATGRMETGFLLWCRNIHDWQRADREAQEAGHRIRSLEARRRELSEQARELLGRHRVDTGEKVTSRDLASLINQLGPRIRTHAELHSEIRGARQRLVELDSDIEQLVGQHQALYEQAGIEYDDRASMVRHAGCFEDWRKLQQQRGERSIEVKRLETRLKADQELLELARGQNRHALEQLHESLQEQVTRRDELNRRIAALHTRHEDVLERRELEMLTGQLETQRLLLSDELDRHLLAGAGQALLEDVRSAHQADNEPATFSRATRWFERFTRQRYRLSFRDGQFEAFDTRSERTMAVGELSTATRVQLLFALRLAWIEQAERSVEPLPVFMDEVLTTTDPERYRLVVESLQDIVGNDRQLFYLTAQPGEAAAWASWSGEGPEPHIVDMAEARREQVEPLTLTMPESESRRRDVPEPADMTPQQWARAAGIGAIDPWQGSGRISVFHILHDDLELAARLIRAELAHLGELRTYLQSSVDSDLIAEPEQASLERRCRAAALILEDWRGRHDRPVDAATLHAFGQITNTFLPRVLELSRSVDGNPRALIEGLKAGEVARFRSDVTAQLEDWLVDNGYIGAQTSNSPVSAAELASRTGMEVAEAAGLREWIISAIDDPLSNSPT